MHLMKGFIGTAILLARDEISSFINYIHILM